MSLLRIDIAAHPHNLYIPNLSLLLRQTYQQSCSIILPSPMSAASSSPVSNPRPRNKKLSAYYNLSSSADALIPSTTSNGTFSIPPVPNTADRATALAHARNLTQTLPLPLLLSHTTSLRTTATKLDTSLSATTHKHYKHLQSAYQVSASTKQVSQDLLQTVSEKTEHHISTLSKISDQLAPSRDTLCKLEASSTLTRLIQAAKILSKSLSILYADLELCTDPTTAQNKLLVAARRTYAVKNALSRLVTEINTENNELISANNELSNTIEFVSKALHERLISPLDDNQGDQDALPPHLAAQVLLLLGEKESIVRASYLQAVTSSIFSSGPNLRIARYPAVAAVSYGKKERLPAAINATNHFFQIFEDATNESNDLVVWLVDLANESIATPVRKAMSTETTSKSNSEKEEAETALRNALIQLKEKCLSSGESLAAKIFREMVDTILEERAGAAALAAVKACENAAESISTNNKVSDVWTKLQDEIEGSMKKEEAVRRVLYMIGERENILGLSRMKRLIEFVKTTGVSVDLNMELLEKRILNIVVSRISEGLDKDDIGMVIKWLKQGIECGDVGGLELLKLGHSDDLIVNEGLATMVKRAWLEMIRRKKFEDKEMVNKAMVHAMVVMILSGNDYMLYDIEAYLLERCTNEKIAILSINEAKKKAEEMIEYREETNDKEKI